MLKILREKEKKIGYDAGQVFRQDRTLSSNAEGKIKPKPGIIIKAVEQQQLHFDCGIRLVTLSVKI